MVRTYSQIFTAGYEILNSYIAMNESLIGYKNEILLNVVLNKWPYLWPHAIGHNEIENRSRGENGEKL